MEKHQPSGVPAQSGKASSVHRDSLPQEGKLGHRGAIREGRWSAPRDSHGEGLRESVAVLRRLHLRTTTQH